MSIGDRLKELRGDENQAKFGERFGKGRNTILRYETGVNPLDTDFVAALCREYQVSPTWLLLGEGPKELAPYEVDAAVDMVKTTLGDDPEAAKRQAQRLIDAGMRIRQSRQEAEQLAATISANLGLDAAKADALRHLLQAPTYERLSAEQQRDQAYSKHHRPPGSIPRETASRSAQQMAIASFDDLGMAEGMGLLSRIYSSGDIVFIRAINANLMAFGEAIANKSLALETMKKMEKMESRLEALEQRGMEADPEKKEKAA